MNPVSMDLAVANVLMGSVWAAMPRMTEQSKALMQGALSHGIQYEVLIQNTPDADQVDELTYALSKRLREVEQVSYSPESTKLYIYSFSKGDQVRRLIKDAAMGAGLMDMKLVYSRGKSFTYNTGL